MSETERNLLEGELEDAASPEAAPESETQVLRREMAETRAQVARVVNDLRGRIADVESVQQPVTPPPFAPPLPQEVQPGVEVERPAPTPAPVLAVVNRATVDQPAKKTEGFMSSIRNLFKRREGAADKPESDLWKRRRSIALGALIGTFFTPVVGTVAGAAIGASRKPKDS